MHVYVHIYMYTSIYNIYIYYIYIYIYIYIYAQIYRIYTEIYLLYHRVIQTLKLMVYKEGGEAKGTNSLGIFPKIHAIIAIIIYSK